MAQFKVWFTVRAKEDNRVIHGGYAEREGNSTTQVGEAFVEELLKEYPEYTRDMITTTTEYYVDTQEAFMELMETIITFTKNPYATEVAYGNALDLASKYGAYFRQQKAKKKI